jgi:hypothetical protein
LFLGQSLNVIEICRVNDHFPIGLINDWADVTLDLLGLWKLTLSSFKLALICNSYLTAFEPGSFFAGRWSRWRHAAWKCFYKHGFLGGDACLMLEGILRKVRMIVCNLALRAIVHATWLKLAEYIVVSHYSAWLMVHHGALSPIRKGRRLVLDWFKVKFTFYTWSLSDCHSCLKVSCLHNIKRWFWYESCLAVQMRVIWKS